MKRISIVFLFALLFSTSNVNSNNQTVDESQDACAVYADWMASQFGGENYWSVWFSAYRACTEILNE